MSPHDPTPRVITRGPLIGVATALAVALLLGPELSAWRAWVLAGVVALILGMQAVERWRGVPWPALAGVVFTAQLSIILVTGGVNSPVLLIMVPFSVLAGLALGQRSVPFAALEAGVPWALLALELSPWLPEDFTPERIGGAWPLRGLLIWCGTLSAALLGGNALARSARRTLDADRERALAAERAITEAHAQRSADLVALSGAVAHELKNPLTATLSLTSFQHRRAPEGSPEREQLGVMLAELRRMRETLDELRTLARPLDLPALAPVDLAELSRSVLAAQAALAEEAEVRLGRPEGAASAWADARKIAQVIENLLQNAIWACGPGDAVGLNLRESDEHAILEVWDAGRGLPEGDPERLFAPGFTTRGEGTGLGLSVCRAIAEQHGGRLQLAPRPAGGCAATLSLPRAAPTEATP
ncbi:MAG: HAMP domain-containing histidine kinase [Alphaproteobacteria bacterium]|nr:HAMP domain-containing histidine kinase [Alphaproteobacteria bacterium]MCB9791529.1 HAMP domain-containing histidine kinase [Alphaproteobacteria bacterium]